MTLLAAGFLAGLAALALPWWLHRRDFRSATPARASSLLLMRAAEAPQAERKVLRYRWLLSARLALLMLAALAFAEPVLERFAAAPGAATPTRLLVVDTSASMAAVWEEARAQALDLVAGRGGVVSAGASAELLLAPASEPEQRAALETLTPGHGHLSFDGLASRLSGLADTLAAPGETLEIHLVSDFQASAVPARFNALVEGVRHPLRLHRVTGSGPNFSIERLDGSTVTLRGDDQAARSLPLEVRLEDEPVARQVVEVPAGGRVVVDLPALPASRHDQRLTARLDVDDALVADNEAFHVLRAARPRTIPVLGADGGQLRYAQAALAAMGAAVPVGAEGSGVLDSAAVALFVDAPEWEGELTTFLEGGGAALVVVGERWRRAGAVLGERLGGRGLADRTGSGVVLKDAAHSTLQRFRDWQDVRVFDAVALPELATSAAEVLLALDDGTPLLVERSVGQGRVLVLLTALDPAWGNLTAAPAFVSFLDDALAYLGRDVLPASALAGERFALPARNVQIIDAAGNRLLSLAQTAGRGVVAIAGPGHYELRAAAGGDDGRRYLAVNVPPQESALAPLAAGVLEPWRDAVGAPAARVSSAVVDADAGLRLAPWLLLALLVLLIVEPLVANGPWRRGRPA